MQYTSSGYFFAVPTRVRHENTQFHFLCNPSGLCSVPKFVPCYISNEHRRAVDKTNIKSKPTTVSEHFLSHSNHSHTDMQSDAVNPRGGHLGIFWVGMGRPELQIGTPS